MNQVDKVLNTPVLVTFKLGGDKTATYEFHELTLLEHSELRAKLMHRARNEWLDRIKAIAGTVDSDRERRKFLAEAAQHEPDWTPELVRLSFTPEGIQWGLQLGAKPRLTDEVIKQLNQVAENSDAVGQALAALSGQTYTPPKAEANAETEQPPLTAVGEAQPAEASPLAAPPPQLVQ